MQEELLASVQRDSRRRRTQMQLLHFAVQLLNGVVEVWEVISDTQEEVGEEEPEGPGVEELPFN